MRLRASRTRFEELTECEKSATFPKNPDVVRFPKILRFSTINSVKAGWLRKKSGTWTLTDEGKAALHEFSDPEALFKESRRLYKQWKASQPDEDTTAPTEAAALEDESEPGEKGLIAATTLEEAEEAARQAILDYLASINPYGFQDLVGKLLEAMGYHVVWIAPKGKDGGPRSHRSERSARSPGAPDQRPGQASSGQQDHGGGAPFLPVAGRIG